MKQQHAPPPPPRPSISRLISSGQRVLFLFSGVMKNNQVHMYVPMIQAMQGVCISRVRSNNFSFHLPMVLTLQCGCRGDAFARGGRRALATSALVCLCVVTVSITTILAVRAVSTPHPSAPRTRRRVPASLGRSRRVPWIACALPQHSLLWEATQLRKLIALRAAVVLLIILHLCRGSFRRRRRRRRRTPRRRRRRRRRRRCRRRRRPR